MRDKAIDFHFHFLDKCERTPLSAVTSKSHENIENISKFIEKSTLPEVCIA